MRFRLHGRNHWRFRSAHRNLHDLAPWAWPISVSLGVNIVSCILCAFLARLLLVIALHFLIKTCIFTIFSVFRVYCWDAFICTCIGGFQVLLKVGILVWDDDEAQDKISEQSVEKQRRYKNSRLGIRTLHTPRVDLGMGSAQGRVVQNFSL